MCIGCQAFKNKKELIRIVRTPEGEFLIDPTGKKSGRGAYVCCEECFCKAVKEKRFEKNFKQSIPADVYEVLKQGIKK